MTLKQLTDSVNELKEIYPFEDDKTEICIVHNLKTNIDNIVSLKTVHGNGISIQMDKVVSLGISDEIARYV